ncbi:ankyrin repeat-containing domain protein [Xylaria cubensis]|nr:ankyrin repeat-containing domain protein [Xylaria cubensis]
MDPLSLTASIIAVITAAGQVTKGLRTLYELRHAPEEVLALADEVNEFQALTYLVQKATRNVSTSDLASEDQLILKRLLDSAKEPLEELDELIAVCIRKANTSNNESGVYSKISFKAWIRSRKSIGSLKERLLRAQRNISTALIALGNIRGQADNQLIMSIHDLVLNQAKESETPTRPKEEHPPGLARHLGYVPTEKLDESISDQNTGVVLENGSSSPTYAVKLEEISITENEVTISTDHKHRDPSATFASSWVALSVNSCVQTCRCRCHRRTRLESSRWSKDVLGTLFYSYVGARPCNMVKCIQPPSSSYQLTYHFPRWILNRAFTLDLTYGSLGGLSGSWSISFPRAISVSHKVWQHIQQHDTTEFRSLLRQRVIYVNDMADDDGTPLLTYALKFRSYDIVGLLLEYGANLDLVDPRGISARAYAQSSLLMDRPIKRPPWSVYIGFNTNELDVHNDLCFNPLHFIVIGLEKADLCQQLRLNRAYMDNADAFGRSPLHWAVITGNVNAVEALIEYGASTTCVDKQQMTPLHAVFLAPSSVQVQCGRLLVDAGADVDALDAWERTPIRIAAGFNSISLEFLSMLVQKGADIDRRDIYGQSPLLKSIQGRKEATQLLLYHGADEEARDEYGNTPILEAIYRDKPCRLQILLEHGARIDEPFELKPGRPARSGPIHLLDFIAWYGGTEAMMVIEEVLDCRYNLCYPSETVEESRDFRLANGRKAGEKECEAFCRILSKLQLNNDSEDSDAESFSDAHE